MNNTKIEEAYNDTFSGLTMYYRDCELSQNLISKYSINQIIMEKGFTDVSSFAEGLGKNLRYAIASNKAVNMGQVNPDVAKFGFHLISSNGYFKVLDIYIKDNKTQILLLNIDEKHLETFKSSTSNIEEKVIGMGRESLDKKIQMEPSQVLNEKQWTERTQFPIGMTDNGEFFLSENKIKKQPVKSSIEKNNLKVEHTKKEIEKKGFWRRLFG